MSTMSFGKRNRLSFISGGPLSQCAPPTGPAIYAVTYKQDPDFKPKSHTVLYFGEASDLSEQARVIHTNLNNWWDKNGRDQSELFIFFRPMPGSSQYERANVQHQLVLEYDPQAND